MNNRIWAVVALFGGLAAMLGVWLVMTGTDPGTGPGRAGIAAKEGPTKLKAATPIAPEALHQQLNVANLKIRQQMVEAVVARGGPNPNVPAIEARGVFRLDQDGADAAVRKHRADVDACYQAAKAHEPGLAKDTILELQITPDPKHRWSVISDVKSTLGSAFDPCVLAVLSGLPFDSGEASTLRYPIQFGP